MRQGSCAGAVSRGLQARALRVVRARQDAYTLAGRLMVISDSVAPYGSFTAWDALRRSLSQMSTHAYLPWSAQERALALLREATTISRVTCSARQAALATCAAAASHDAVAFITSGTKLCQIRRRWCRLPVADESRMGRLSDSRLCQMWWRR